MAISIRRWQTYEEAFTLKQYDRALRALDHPRLLLNGAPIYRDLPYYYNRANLNLILYFETGKSRYLQHARLDFTSAIKACPHFYFAYLGNAQISFLLRDYQIAYRNIRNLIDVFEAANDINTDILLISSPDFTGVMYLPDLYMNGGLALFRLGSSQQQSDDHYNYAIKLLGNDARATHRHYRQHKRQEYLNTRYAQLQTQQLIGFDIYSRFERFDTSYDGGPFNWLPLSEALRKYAYIFRLLTPTEDKKPVASAIIPPPPPPRPPAIIEQQPSPEKKKSKLRALLCG